MKKIHKVFLLLFLTSCVHYRKVDIEVTYNNGDKEVISDYFRDDLDEKLLYEGCIRSGSKDVRCGVRSYKILKTY